MPDSSKATSMAELMARHASAFTILKKGDKVSATVNKITGSEVFVMINGKTEALVLEKDRNLFKQMIGLVNVGDSVEAVVLSPENELGIPVVSLRHFLEERMWGGLEELQKSQSKVNILVKEATKGGFVVESEAGISGFLPNSHVATGEDTTAFVGKTIKASIVDLDREQNKVIFSQKGIVSPEEFKALTSHLKAGSTVHGTISGITNFGLFVSLPRADKNGYLDGLVHISEVSWEKVEDLQELFVLGQEVDAVVVGVDPSAKRIDLSIKRLSKDPFEEVSQAYPVDKKINGEVVSIGEVGVVVALPAVGDVAVEGLIKREKISPNTTYTVGQKINVTVSQIDNRKRKILLSPVLLEKPLMYR